MFRSRKFQLSVIFICSIVMFALIIPHDSPLKAAAASLSTISTKSSSMPAATLNPNATKKPLATPTKKPAATHKQTAAPTKKPKPAATAKPVQEVYYKNCTAVRAAGAAPIHAGDPGYSKKLDRDGDGIGCE